VQKNKPGSRLDIFRGGWFHNSIHYLLAIIMILSFMLPLAVNSGEAEAQVATGALTIGPVNPANGFPASYTGANGVSLDLCLDNNGKCVLAADATFNPALPVVFPTNFPGTAFYFLADSNPLTVGPTGAGRARLRIAVEASFTAAPAVGQQITFSRIVLQRITNLTPNSTFTVTYPYGTFTFTSDAAGDAIGGVGNQAFRTQDGCAGAPCDFTLLLPAPTTHITTFLTWTGLPAGGLLDAATGNHYIGDAVTPHTVTGSPLGQNFVRITGPDIGGLGINTIQTDLFTVAGKITAPAAAPAPAPGTVPAPGPAPAPVPAPGTVPAPAPVPAGPPMIGLEIFAQIPIDVLAPLAAGARADSTAIPVGGPLGAVPLFVILGGVTAVNAAGTEWQIGTPPTFVYTHSGTRLTGAPVVGSVVRIIALRSVAPGPIMADVIGARPGTATAAPANVQVISLLFNGIVNTVSPTIWNVGGVDFTADGAVIDPGLVVGSAVTVEFSPPLVLPPGTVVGPPPIPALAPAAAPMTFGAINPVTAVPRWFRDAAGIALDFCVDPVLCIADPVDPAIPFSVQTGFGHEAFYWSASANVPTAGGSASLILGWEVAYLNGNPAPGDTIMFGRIRVLATGLTAGATYTVTHPYGTDTFVAADRLGATGGLARQIFATDDVGCFAVPCDFNAALASRIKRFLVWDSSLPFPPPGYVGDGATAHRVVGSPLGTNFFRMDGPNVGGPGINTVQTDLFVVTGKILPAAATAISVTLANPVVAVGNTVPLTVAVTDQFGMPIDTGLTLVSSNPAVGTINPLTGVFTAVAPGTTTITATSGVLTASTTITVSTPTPVLTTINVTPATATVVVGSTQALTISMRDQFSALFTIPPPAAPVTPPATPPATAPIPLAAAPIPLAAAPAAPTFSSSNPLVGTVNPTTGLFTAVGAGTATVTATSGTVTGTATLRVTTAAPALGSLAITPATASIAIGATRTFTASALDQFGVAIPTSATFASSNGAVGTINAAGVFTPLGAGTTTISATNGTITGSATVTVTSVGMRAAAPIAAATGYPRFYTDASGLSLELCLDTNGFCVLAPLPNPAAAVSFPGNFPDESFYYIADSNPMNVGPAGAGRARMRMVLEGAFATGTPAAGQGITFLRLNLARTTGLTPNSTYTATYPFGTFTFTTDATGIAGASMAGQAFRTEEGCAAAPCDFTLVLPAPVTHMTNFLTWTGLPPGGLLDLATGNRYIGDGGTPHTIIPGPSGNFFRITGPNIGGTGVNTIQTDLWTVAGKIAPAAVVAAAAAPVTAAAATPIGVPVATLTTINVTPPAAAVVVGGTQAFTSAALDQLGAPFTAAPTFSSSNPAVGAINPTTGLFTAMAAGTTTITATSGAISGTATVSVSPAPIAPVAPVIAPRPPVFFGGGGGGGGGGFQVFGGGGSGVSGGGGFVAPLPGSATAGQGQATAISLPPGTIAPAKGPVKISQLSVSGSGNAPAAPRQPVLVEMGGVEYRVDFTQFNPTGQVSTIVAIKGGITVSYGSIWAGFTPDQVLADAIFNNDAIGQAVALAGGAKPLGEVK